MKKGQIIYRNGQRLICTRTRQSGLYTFQVIDFENKPVIEYYKNSPAMVKDHGIRLIRYENDTNIRRTPDIL